MTREEAIDFLECRRTYYASLSTDPNPCVKATKICNYTLAESAKACLMGIEALKRKPCYTDAEIQKMQELEQAEIQKAYELGEASQPKTGHWIKEESIYGWNGHSYQCSVCGRSIHLDTEVEDLEDYPFCHCGAKMTESEKDDLDNLDLMLGDLWNATESEETE